MRNFHRQNYRTYNRMKIRFVLQNNQYFILDISCVLLLHIYTYLSFSQMHSRTKNLKLIILIHLIVLSTSYCTKIIEKTIWIAFLALGYRITPSITRKHEMSPSSSRILHQHVTKIRFERELSSFVSQTRCTRFLNVCMTRDFTK